MRKLINISGIMLLAFICSCTSVLDKEDFSAITPTDVWENENMIDAVLNDIHGALMPAWPYNGWLSDEAAQPNDGFDAFLQGTATIDSWDNWPYTHIEKINFFLRNIEQTTFDDRKSSWRGQALFWRAWCYFSMVRGYGGVPLILEPQDVSNKESLFVERSSTSACFEQIVKDLDDAIAGLPDSWDAGQYGRIDKGAAMAFKGRVLLFQASPLFNPDRDIQRWTKAYEANKAAVEYLNSQGKGLYPDFADIWYDERNQEVVMVNQFFAPDHKFYQGGIRPMSYTRDAVAQNLPLLNTVNAFPMRDGSDFDPTKPFAYGTLFKSREDRFYATVAYNGCDYRIKELNPGEHLWIGRTPDGASLEFLVHNPAENFEPAFTGFMTKKSVDPNIEKATVNDATVDWIEIRYAEVYMNYGECANEIGKTDEALKVLYDIRKRANILPGSDNRYGIKETSVNDIRERYIKERFIEFLFENKRLDDLRRWRRFDIVNNQQKRYAIESWLKPGIDIPKKTDDINAIWDHFEIKVVEESPRYTYNMKDQYYFYAIPKKHLDANSKLQQNNNWDGGTFDPLK